MKLNSLEYKWNLLSIIITVILAVLVLIVGHKAKKQDPNKPSKGLVLVFEILIDWINGMCKENLGPKWKKYAPMIVTLALFIFIHAFKNLKEILDLFLEKTPRNISINELKEHLMEIKGIKDVHHIHVWSMDGVNNYATMHVVVSSSNVIKIKKKVREEMLEHGIVHTTIEIENDGECDFCECQIINDNKIYHHHH